MYNKRHVRQAKLGKTNPLVADRRNSPRRRRIRLGTAGGDKCREAQARKCSGRNALSGVKEIEPRQMFENVVAEVL